MVRPCHARGFSLVELLVVITIIVVLLALLTPALDKAIYQAQLAVCATGMRGVADGVTLYAWDNKRFYPLRLGAQDNSSTYVWSWKPTHIMVVDAKYDLRPALRPYISINKTLNDPLAPGKVDFDPPNPLLPEIIEVGYDLWFGWQFTDPTNGGPGMRKVGDRFEWRKRRFSILMSDYDEDDYNYLNSSTTYQLTSHPDHDGRMVPNLPIRWGSTSPPRSKIDVNYAMADLSVQRLNDMGLGRQRDPGVFKVPTYSQYTRQNSDNDGAPKQYIIP